MCENEHTVRNAPMSSAAVGAGDSVVGLIRNWSVPAVPVGIFERSMAGMWPWPGGGAGGGGTGRDDVVVAAGAVVVVGAAVVAGGAGVRGAWRVHASASALT